MIRSVILFSLLLLLQTNVFSQQSFAIVELFTSQGCSSCPAADAVLSDIKRDAEKAGLNIITLQYHVDYWNKFGWKDPYSKIQYTIRQENYSRVLPEKEMFTPQAIVNGMHSFTGSDKKKMKDEINRALSEKPTHQLNIKIDSLANDTIYFSYNISMSNTDCALRLVLTEDDLSCKIEKGENAGKVLHHDSVVRYFYSIDSPPKVGNFKLSLKVFSGAGPKHLIAFVQQKKLMKVLAAKAVNISDK